MATTPHRVWCANPDCAGDSCFSTCLDTPLGPMWVTDSGGAVIAVLDGAGLMPVLPPDEVAALRADLAQIEAQMKETTP